MDGKIVDEILEYLKPKIKNNVLVDEKNFNEIKLIDSDKSIAFVDAGNTEIFKAPDFSLQFLRVYYCIYKKNKRIFSEKNECYVLISAFSEKNNIFYKTKFFSIKDSLFDREFVFDSFDENLKEGKNRIEISKIINTIRRFAELKTAEKIIDESKAGFIVLDGDLDAKLRYEKGILEKIYEKANEKNIGIGALSKTSDLLTEDGISVISILNLKSPKIKYFYKIPNNDVFDRFIIKLNEKSGYVFKFDASSRDFDEFLSVLALNSNDPIFIGYPYGLVDADKFARVSNNEKEYLKTIFSMKIGKEFNDIIIHENALNAHDMLDNIS